MKKNIIHGLDAYCLHWEREEREANLNPTCHTLSAFEWHVPNGNNVESDESKCRPKKSVSRHRVIVNFQWDLLYDHFQENWIFIPVNSSSLTLTLIGWEREREPSRVNVKRDLHRGTVTQGYLFNKKKLVATRLGTQCLVIVIEAFGPRICWTVSLVLVQQVVHSK